MTEFTLTRSQIVPRPLEEVFAFFADARNLSTITPPWLSFRIASDGPIPMEVGTVIDYVIKLRGLPMRWQSEITAWDPPIRFVDVQRKGPYRSWIHEHRFEAIDIHRTRIEDVVRYSVPGGKLVNTLFVRADLERIFDYRTQKLGEIFSGPRQVAGAGRRRVTSGSG